MSESGTVTMPRDLIHFLETEIANLENEIAQHDNPGLLVLLDQDNEKSSRNNEPDADCTMSDVPPPQSMSINVDQRRQQQEQHQQHQQQPQQQASKTDLDLWPSPVESFASLTKSAVIASSDIRRLLLAYDAGAGHPATNMPTCIHSCLTPSRIILLNKATISHWTNPRDMLASLHNASVADEVKSLAGMPKLVPAQVLLSLPQQLTHRLVTKFVQRFLSAFPILPESELWNALERVVKMMQECNATGVAIGLGGDAVDSIIPTSQMLPVCFEVLVVYLVLAISLTLDSFRGGFAGRCMGLSTDLFNEGVRHLLEKESPVLGDDVATLRVLLLMLQYAMINPQCANVSIVGGLATELCLKLGLDRETPWTTVVDAETVELRRQLFWAWYCLESTVCSSLLLPLSIQDESITTQLPATAEMSGPLMVPAPQAVPPPSLSALPLPSASGGEVFGEATQHSILLTQFHRRRNRILEVHFQDAPLPLEFGGSFAAWQRSTESELRAWYDLQVRHVGSDISELTEYGLAHTMILLHRATPRNPNPSPESILRAFEAAATMGRILLDDSTNGGFLRRRYLSAHHTFDVAMVALFCLRHGRSAIRAHFNIQRIFEITKLFTSNFLALAAQGWADGSTSAGDYECLLAPVLRYVLAGTDDDPDAVFPSDQDEKLRQWMSVGHPGIHYQAG